MSKIAKNKINLFPLVNLTVLGLLSLVTALVLFNLQFLKDTYTVWAVPTPPETLALVKNAGMNSKGEFYYKASQPELAQAEDFNEVCRYDREQSDAILGCYTNKKIYIYNVKDERVKGVKEVTAAHEGLHAVYDRLSTGDKNYVNDLLDSEYESRKSTDPDLKEKMAYYSETEPGEFYNELHSIIGTEKASISRSLEDYYSKYFEDRTKVVKLHESYASTIKNLADNANKLRNELEVSKANIESSVNKYNKDVEDLNNDILVFNKNAQTAGYFKSQSEFQNARQVLSRRVVQLDQDHASIQQEISKYDQLVLEFNQVALQINDVNNSLNSTLAPKPSL